MSPLDAAKPLPRERRNRDSEMMRAALELFARKGYAATAVQDIGDAIGVLKGSVYHYIGSKEDLLFRIFNEAHLEAEAMMQEVSSLETSAKDRLRAYIYRYLLTTLRNTERASLYFRDWRQLTGDRLETIRERRSTLERFLRGLILECYEEEGLTSDVSPKYVSLFVIGGTNWVADWFDVDGRDDVEKVAESCTEVAMASILAGTRASRR